MTVTLLTSSTQNAMFPVLVRHTWFKIFHDHYSNDPNRIVQLLFDIRHKLLSCTAKTQTLLPQLNLLCQEFHQFVDIRQQQDLSDFYTIILDQVHDILNNDTQHLHVIDDKQELLFQENLQEYFVRRSTKYWSVMRNSLLTQYQNIWTLSIMNCQFCLHRKCENCPCTRVKFNVKPSWLLHVDVTAAKPGVQVAFLDSNGKPSHTWHFDINNLVVIVDNNWESLLTTILHRQYTFTEIAFTNNVITLTNLQEEIHLLVYTTEYVQKENDLHRIVSRIHSGKTLSTFPVLLHFFDALTNCICFQRFSQETYCIPVAISQSTNSFCADACKVLAMPYFLTVNDENSIKNKLFRSHFVSIMNPKSCVIYARENVSGIDCYDLMQWDILWNKGNDIFNTSNIQALTQGAEILIITSQHLSPFHVCFCILFDRCCICMLLL